MKVLRVLGFTVALILVSPASSASPDAPDALDTPGDQLEPQQTNQSANDTETLPQPEALIGGHYWRRPIRRPIIIPITHLPPCQDPPLPHALYTHALDRIQRRKSVPLSVTRASPGDGGYWGEATREGSIGSFSSDVLQTMTAEESFTLLGYPYTRPRISFRARHQRAKGRGWPESREDPGQVVRQHQPFHSLHQRPYSPTLATRPHASSRSRYPHPCVPKSRPPAHPPKPRTPAHPPYHLPPSHPPNHRPPSTAPKHRPPAHPPNHRPHSHPPKPRPSSHRPNHRPPPHPPTPRQPPLARPRPSVPTHPRPVPPPQPRPHPPLRVEPKPTPTPSPRRPTTLTQDPFSLHNLAGPPYFNTVPPHILDRNDKDSSAVSSITSSSGYEVWATPPYSWHPPPSPPPSTTTTTKTATTSATNYPSLTATRNEDKEDPWGSFGDADWLDNWGHGWHPDWPLDWSNKRHPGPQEAKDPPSSHGVRDADEQGAAGDAENVVPDDKLLQTLLKNHRLPGQATPRPEHDLPHTTPRPPFHNDVAATTTAPHALSEPPLSVSKYSEIPLTKDRTHKTRGGPFPGKHKYRPPPPPFVSHRDEPRGSNKPSLFPPRRERPTGGRMPPGGTHMDEHRPVLTEWPRVAWQGEYAGMVPVATIRRPPHAPL